MLKGEGSESPSQKVKEASCWNSGETQQATFSFALPIPQKEDVFLLCSQRKRISRRMGVAS